MIREAIGEASTIEEAKENALTLLNAPENADVKFDTISLPQKKVLGLFGGSKAKVRVYFDDGKEEPKPTPPAPEKPKVKAEPKKAEKKPAKPVSTKAETTEKPEKQEKPKVSVPAEQIESMAKEAKAYLELILTGLKIDGATVKTTQGENSILLSIDYDDYGIIVGRRGETLDSIQYLVSLVVNKNCNGYVRVTVNAGDYREKREATLRGVARKNGLFVARTGKRTVLEPMNPYERRIIHTTVQEMENVTSRSVGSNGDRKVVIELAEGATPNPSLGGGNRNRGPRKGGHSNRGPRPQADKAVDTPVQKKLDKSDMPKFGKIE